MIDRALGAPLAAASEAPRPPLSADQRRALVELARRTVARVAASGGSYRAGAGAETDAGAGAPPAGLDRPGAAFVTVRVAGELRGCIGTFEPQRSLWRAVKEMAVEASTRDPRFDHIAEADLPELAIEISVLSPARLIHDPREIEIGRHGLEVRLGSAHGLLLPQVAADHDLDRETFLAETCRKAGLSREAWRDPEAEVRVFEAEVFGDGA